MRNYAASLGLAILGTVLVTEMRSHVTASLESMGVPHGTGRHRSRTPGRGQVGRRRHPRGSIPHFFELDFAYATRSVLWCMALVMAVAAVVGVVGLTRGRQELGDGVDWDGDTAAGRARRPDRRRGRSVTSPTAPAVPPARTAPGGDAV